MNLYFNDGLGYINEVTKVEVNSSKESWFMVGKWKFVEIKD